MTVNTRTDNGVIRELAIRADAHGTIGLYWNSETEEISLVVKTDSEDFTVSDIPKDSALDAWNHPYAYAEWALKTGKSRLNVAA
jgi:hypothetical protein